MLFRSKNHLDDNGIIHSASYEFSREIMKRSKFRHKFIEYTSENKLIKIKKFLKAKGKILLGPSHMEGLDLYDDLSRFQIIFKIPFPNLVDPLVSAKLKEDNSEWFSWKTSLNIIQASNRSIRHNHGDWAITYILDACFLQLLNKNLFENDFTKRLKIYESN